jgi:hypothetical protein
MCATIFSAIARFLVAHATLIGYLGMGVILLGRSVRGTLTDVRPRDMVRAFSLACCCGTAGVVLHCLHFVYAAMLINSAVLPVCLCYPLVRRIVVSPGNLLLVLVPFTAVFATLIQLRCTAEVNPQWTYDFSLSNRYLYVIVSGKGFLGGLLQSVGTASQMVEEFLFYIGYVPATACVFVLFRETVSPRWRASRTTVASRAFFPALWVLCGGTLLAGIGWYCVTRSGMLPWHAISAAVPYVLGLLAYARSGAVRKFVSSPLFVVASVLSLLWTALWEFACGGMARLWIYVEGNGLAGVVPFIPRLHFPVSPALGVVPNLSWAVEEWLAYPQLFTFVVILLIWVHDEGLRVWRDGEFSDTGHSASRITFCLED